MSTPELYHLPDEAYTINHCSDTYYEIMFSLKDRDRNDSKPLWKLVNSGELGWYSVLDRIGIEIKYNNGRGYTSYNLRNFYEIGRYHSPNEASYDLDKLHKEIDKLENKLLKYRFKKYHTTELGNIILKKLKDTVMGIIKEPQKFEITDSMYDSDLHVEFIHFNVKDYGFTVEYHFKSADCDLCGQYKGNKIAFIHYLCWKGKLTHDDESEIIKSYTPKGVGYEESCDNLRDSIIEKTGLDEKTVNYEIVAALNERVNIDTNDFLKKHSHLTQFIYRDRGGHLTADWKYEIIASWSKQMLDSLIDSYTNLRSPSTIGAFLINGGLISELKVKVTRDFEPLVDLTIKSPSDPDILKVLSTISHTKEHYMPFRRELELYLTKTFSDEVIRLPEAVDKILNELNATLTQRKRVAEEFKKLS